MFNRNPAKLEARAQGYESRGKLAKALKYRQKAARLSGGQMGGIAPYGAAPLGTQQLVGQQFVGQQLGGQQFVGQQLGGQQFVGSPLIGQQLGGQQFVGQQLGGQQLGGAPLGLQQWTNRTPAIYENNALKWERRGNYAKAQKNRGKVWRLQNPQYAQMAPPAFYQQERFLGYNVPYTPTPVQTGAIHTVMPTTVEHVVRPTIVDQTMRPERIVEVQPIVHREIEAPEVRIVEKHLYETVPSAGPSTITNAPIVQETVIPKIIEEVQPVVHREVPAPFVERVEQHVTEHIVNPTITTKEVINDGTSIAPMGFAAGGPAPLAAQTTAKPGLMGKVQGVLHHNNANSTTTL